MDLLVDKNGYATGVQLPGNVWCSGCWATWEVTIVMPTSVVPANLRPQTCGDCGSTYWYDLGDFKARIQNQFAGNTAFSSTLTTAAAVKIALADTDEVARWTDGSEAGQRLQYICGATDQERELEECTFSVSGASSSSMSWGRGQEEPA